MPLDTTTTDLARSSRFAIVEQVRPAKSAPSLRGHYSPFNASTSRSASVGRIGTQQLVGIAYLLHSLDIAPTPSHVPH